LGDDGGLFDGLEAINFALLLVNQFFLEAELDGNEDGEYRCAPG
jgi:hypothetical protein